MGLTITPSGDMFLGVAQTNTGNKTFNAGTLISGANSTSNSAHLFTASGASLKTSPDVGDLEVDANGFMYYTNAALARGILGVQELTTLNAAYTLGAGTAAQKAFNSTTNGAVTLLGSTTYFFNGFYRMTSLTTNANVGIAFGGAASLTSILWFTFGVKGTTGNAVTTGLNSSMNTTASNALVITATSATTGYVSFWGKVRINAGGTYIPQFSQNIGSASVMEADSSFIIWPVGTSSVVSVGNWS